uniref:Uncharacterized protein n=2 Tax=viral metagenome TaxID=1070528 RepID=A0A6H1ZF78_9ZZZZ
MGIDKKQRNADSELQTFVRGKRGRLRFGVIAYVLAVAILCVVGVAWAIGPWQESAAQAQGGAKIDDDYAAGSVALNAAEADFTLPRAGDPYLVCSYGNDAYILCGTAPVAATTAAGGYSIRVPSGGCIGPIRLTGPVCSHIAGTTTGHIVFHWINPVLR